MKRLAILAIGFWLSAFAVLAQPELGGREDASQPRFDNLDPAQKQRLRQLYRRHQDLAPEERRKVERQFQLWRELSPEQKQKLRKLNADLQSASPEQKAESAKRGQRFSQLAPEQQKEALKRMAEGHRGRPPAELREPPRERRQTLAREYPVWKELSPIQQRTLSFMHHRVENAPPEARPRLEQWMQKFRQLPPERQKQMLDRVSRRLGQKPGRQEGEISRGKAA